MNRAYATILVKAVDDAKRTFTGVASTPSTDRMGDIVEPKGAMFKLPLPLLWQHDAGDPIGWITSARVTASGIEVEGEVADYPDAGPLKERLTQAWQMLKAGLVRGLSIGFNPVESARIDGTYGYRFLKWEWLELSAVTIAANQDASITAIKTLDRKQRAASGRSAASGHRSPGATGFRSNNAPEGNHMKTVQEQLAELRQARETKAARMSDIVQIAQDEGRGTTADEAAEFDLLASEVSKLDDDIRFKTVEAAHASTARPVSQERSAAAASGSRSGGPTIIVRGSDADEKFKGQNYTRMVIAKALARLGDCHASGIAAARWGKSNPTLVRLLKANEVAGGGSGSGEWGAELVQADSRYTGDFISFLTSRTVYDQLPLREIPAHVVIKGQDGGATGYWVGESKPIPASAQDFSTVSLSPLKVAALAVISNELLRDSSPAAEMLVRDALVDASSQRVDNTFLSNVAASAGVSPAGLLNSLVAIGSTGVDADSVRQDIKALYAPFLAAKNANGLSFVMNPALAKALQLMRNALGVREFEGITQSGGTLEGDTVFTGDNVNANHFILLKPSDIYRIGDTGVEVSISREAMIEQSSAPTGVTDTPVAASQAFTSMFQAESTAIKVVRSINFAKRRASAVAYVNDADYGAAAPT